MLHDIYHYILTIMLHESKKNFLTSEYFEQWFPHFNPILQQLNTLQIKCMHMAEPSSSSQVACSNTSLTALLIIHICRAYNIQLLMMNFIKFFSKINKYPVDAHNSWARKPDNSQVFFDLYIEPIPTPAYATEYIKWAP